MNFTSLVHLNVGNKHEYFLYFRGVLSLLYIDLVRQDLCVGPKPLYTTEVNSKLMIKGICIDLVHAAMQCNTTDS